MIVYPKDKADLFHKILKNHPFSRVTTQQFMYGGKSLVSVKSSDLDLLEEVYKTFPINEDSFIKSL